MVFVPKGTAPPKNSLINLISLSTSIFGHLNLLAKKNFHRVSRSVGYQFPSMKGSFGRGILRPPQATGILGLVPEHELLQRSGSTFQKAKVTWQRLPPGGLGNEDSQYPFPQAQVATISSFKIGKAYIEG